MITTYERGKAEGKLEGYHEMALLQLDAKFGPLTPGVQQRVTELAPEQLRQLLVDLVKSEAASLKELHLED
jgi:hypothetical protein